MIISIPKWIRKKRLEAVEDYKSWLKSGALEVVQDEGGLTETPKAVVTVLVSLTGIKDGCHQNALCDNLLLSNPFNIQGSKKL